MRRFRFQRLSKMNDKNEFKIKISILHKIMLYITILIFISVGMSTYLAVKEESKVLTEALIQTGRHMARHIALSTESAFWSLNWIFVEKLLQETCESECSEVIYAKVIKPDGEVYLASEKKYYGEEIDSSLLFDQDTLLQNHFYKEKQENGILIVRPLTIGKEIWYVFIGLSRQPVDDAIKALIIRNMEWCGLILMLAITCSFFLSKSISKPITDLANFAKTISCGNLDQEITVNSKDEIGLLGHAFKKMIQNLKAARGELENYSENLEKMVEERTSELKKALSDLQNTQSQLLQAEKLASIGQLAAGVAHEINNPVGFVKSNLGIIEEYRTDLTELLESYGILEAVLNKEDKSIQKALKDIQIIKDEIDIDFIQDDYAKVIAESLEGMDRVAKIVADLRDFAHVDKAELEHTDINKGIESTLNIVWNELKYKAEVIKDLGELPLVKCYPQRMNQVFTNIFVNAAHAIDKKGEIKISTLAYNEHVEIKISDTGSGIPPEVIPKIFDPFFTTKEVGKGTGLGLNMAYNIIKKHQGTIDVESEVGKGTTFTIRLQVEPDLVE